MPIKLIEYKLCYQGLHKMSPDNLQYVKNSKQINCRECRRISARKTYHKRRPIRIRDRKEYSHKFYAINKEKAKAYQKNRCSKTRAKINKYKNKPCMDCNKTYPFYVMDFDHRPNEIKLFCVGRALTFSWHKIKAEIDKCDIVCSNCHRIRTYKRMTYKF